MVELTLNCDFYGTVIIEPNEVKNDAGAPKAMTNRIADKFMIAGINDYIVAVEMTGVYYRPVQRAFRQAAFDIRIVQPFCIPVIAQSLRKSRVVFIIMKQCSTTILRRPEAAHVAQSREGEWG